MSIQNQSRSDGAPWVLSKDRIDRFNFDDSKRLRDSFDVFLNINQNLETLTKLNSLSKGFLARSVTIGTTPTLITSSARAKAIRILNPSLSSGLTSSGTLLSSAVRGVGTYNTRAVPLGVSNYQRMTLFLDITANAGAGTLIIDAETRDQLSLGWMGSQADLFAGKSAVRADGDMGYTAELGNIGVNVEFAIEATVGVAAITFSVGYTLKDGLPGTGTGASSTIYIGPSDAISSISGLPILSGQKEDFLIDENTELWGVALAADQQLRVFELN